jgi:hypothetical protein
MSTTTLVLMFVMAVAVNLFLGYVFRPRFYIPVIITWSVVWLAYAIYVNVR